MVPRHFKLLSFDVMGTLIDYERGMLEYLRPRASRAANDEAILEAIGRTEARRYRTHPELPFTRLLAGLYRDVADELGLAQGPGEAEGFGAAVAAWPPFPDSVATLRRLGAHFRLVALTNAHNAALDLMARTLGGPFHDRVTAEDVGVVKPDPQVFAYCRGRQSAAGFGLGDWLHVAQSQFHDIAVAKRLGFTVAWIERRQGKAGSGATPAVAAPAVPDYHFASLAELADALLPR